MILLSPYEEDGLDFKEEASPCEGDLLMMRFFFFFENQSP